METLEAVGNGIYAVFNWLLQNILLINLFLSVVIVFFQRRDPRTVWTWLFALYFVPVFGILFYLLFGQDFRKSKMFRIKEVEDRLSYSVKSQEHFLKEYRIFEANDPVIRDYGNLVLYNLQTCGSVLTIRNRLDIFSDGEEKFADLREELRRAKEHIHILYYIIKNDEVFESLVPILKEKVKQGVEVRLLVDGMGGRFMPGRRWRELREAGIKVGIFFPPILGRLNLRINYRNHRKIVVIDRKVGYVGGFNIGKEYISKDPKFGYWRDTHLKIKGDAVLSLQIRFALDWNYACRENLFLDMKYFESGEEPARQSDEAKLLEKEIMGSGKPPWSDPGYMKSDDKIGIQIISSGPDMGSRVIRDNYLELFHKAKNHIYIQTPYFVPDDAILSALKIAARSGVDVRLMIPCMPDHPFVYWATYSYAGDLIEAGAKCYIYENGFLHAKGVMVDGMVSSYGTANMDIRSFELNFEVNAVIYDEASTEQLEQIFLDDLDRCKEMTKAVYEERGVIIRIKEQFSRLLSPLL